MKRALGVIVVLALTAVGAALAYQAAAREQQYRVLVGRGDLALRDGETFGAIERSAAPSPCVRNRCWRTPTRREVLAIAAIWMPRRATSEGGSARPSAPALEALGDVLYGGTVSRAPRLYRAASAWTTVRARAYSSRSTLTAMATSMPRSRRSPQTLRLNDQLPDATITRPVSASAQAVGSRCGQSV